MLDLRTFLPAPGYEHYRSFSDLRLEWWFILLAAVAVIIPIGLWLALGWLLFGLGDVPAEVQ